MELHPKETSHLDAFYEGGPNTMEEAFPTLCIRSHWDPTMVSKHILPTQLLAAPAFDPRPATKICTSYYTTSQGDAPLPSAYSGKMSVETPAALLGPSYYRRPVESSDPVFPPGGAASRSVPYSVYASAVQHESDLYRMTEPLTRCPTRRYTPAGGVKDAVQTLPHVSQDFGLSPFATAVNKKAGCREADDQEAWNRSGRLFFNHTRMDRVYPGNHGPLVCK